ncbi:DUF2769 domain-containing protein [Sedimenticola selenatireducens]
MAGAIFCADEKSADQHEECECNECQVVENHRDSLTVTT